MDYEKSERVSLESLLNDPQTEALVTLLLGPIGAVEGPIALMAMYKLLLLVMRLLLEEAKRLGPEAIQHNRQLFVELFQESAKIVDAWAVGEKPVVRAPTQVM